MATSTKVLADAMSLPIAERLRIAEELIASADAESHDDGPDDEDSIAAAWAREAEQRDEELRSGSVRGLSADEARRVVESALVGKPR